MRTLIKHSALALLVMAAGYNVAMADPVNINITGNVVASPCKVNNDSSTLNVDLGSGANSIQASTLAAANDGTTPKAFNLVLTECPSGTTSVKVTFTGTPDTAQPSMFANTGVAQPLAVELSSTTGPAPGVRANNTSVTQPVVSGGVTYGLSARAVTPTGNVIPGDISSVVVANFTYN
ncbi:fimbrial protein [Serratia fonticola]|uniref:fimbrial protein n=1 Tax=Serratia fonticola TaxID=47917 RepID=UPI003AB0F758